MNQRRGKKLFTAKWIGLMVAGMLAAGGWAAEDTSDIREQLRALQRQNEALREELLRQQQLIDSLTNKVNKLEVAGAEHERERGQVKAEKEGAEAPAKPPGWLQLGKVHVSGEGGVGFTHTTRQGEGRHAEFRVDEARLFIEAPIGLDVFLFSELNLATREQAGLNLQLGELYLDVENVSKLWGQERMLNLRLGRLDIPFGEEYLMRDAIDNPLISHSLPDFWGVDEGAEVYGRLGQVAYVLAVQNGGMPTEANFTADKSVTGRVSYDPARWLHLGASAMRTGDLNVQNDKMSQLWFANGFFRSLGSSNTTGFHANLVQGDVQVRLARGHFGASGGFIRYGDNDPRACNGRNIYFYSLEGVHDLTRKLYAGARFSHILAQDGFPLVGNGDFGEYFYRELTRDLWRLSLGAGYRWNPNLVFKVEYTLERGKDYPSGNRNWCDTISAEAVFRF